MRNTMLIAATLAIAAASPAFAQSGSAETPAAPNAGHSEPETANSLPPGAEASTTSSAVAYPTLNSGTSTTTVTPSQ